VEEKLDDDEDTSETSHSGEPGTSLCPVTGYTRNLRRGYKLKLSEKEEMDEEERETSHSD
jgi:hypothetical protein